MTFESLDCRREISLDRQQSALQRSKAATFLDELETVLDDDGDAAAPIGKGRRIVRGMMAHQTQMQAAANFMQSLVHLNLPHSKIARECDGADQFVHACGRIAHWKDCRRCQRHRSAGYLLPSCSRRLGIAGHWSLAQDVRRRLKSAIGYIHELEAVVAQHTAAIFFPLPSPLPQAGEGDQDRLTSCAAHL